MPTVPARRCSSHAPPTAAGREPVEAAWGARQRGQGREMVPGDRQTPLDVAVRSDPGAIARRRRRSSRTRRDGRLGVGMVDHGDGDVDPAGDRFEPIRGDRERHGVVAADLERLVPPRQVRLRPSPDEPARASRPARRAGSRGSAKTSIAELAAFDASPGRRGGRRPGSRRASPRQRWPTIMPWRSTPLAGLSPSGPARKQGNTSARGSRDPVVAIRSASQVRAAMVVSAVTKPREDDRLALDELVQQELSGEEDAELARRGGIDQVDALTSRHRQIDQGQGDLVDPAEVHPFGPATVLEHEPAVARDGDEAGGSCSSRSARPSGHGRHPARDMDGPCLPARAECTPGRYLPVGCDQAARSSTCLRLASSTRASPDAHEERRRTCRGAAQRVVVLPESEHRPAGRAEAGNRCPRPRAVGRELRHPPLPVLLSGGAV